VRRRTVRDGKMGPLQRAVNDYLAGTGNIQRGTSTLCVEVWPQVVGPWYGRKTQILGVDNGEAKVLCDTPATAQQLQMDSEKVIARLNERLGGEFIKRLRASSAGLTLSGLAAELRRPDETAIGQSAIDEVELSEEESAFCTRAAAEIADEKLRESFLGLLRNELKRRYVKRQRGWRECDVCGALHNERGPYCIACATAMGTGSARRRRE